MPFIILVLAGAVIVGGLVAYHGLDIEAYPNPVPPLVEVIAQPEGSSAEEVERYVTIPIELGLTGMPGIDHIRSSSLFGLSDVKCYFKWGTNYKDARQEVLNRLQSIKLPAGVDAGISPWNPIGEIFRYTVQGKGYDLTELKTAQDWILERQFKRVPGVMDVTSFGGETKQFQVGVDPYRLAGQKVSLDDVMQAIAKSNENAGGQRLVLGEQSYNVRGVGILRDIHDIDEIVITEHNGVPVRLREIADNVIGHAPRLGIVGIDHQPDVVQGIVLMRYGSETSKTLEGVHAQLEHIRRFHLLPPGMEVVPYYDRGRLVDVTTHTVLENLLVGMGLVSLVLFLFLGNTRAAIITAINIPIALLVAFSGLVATGTSANLISLGAVDFGIVVDSTVIMMENIFRHVGSHGKGTMKERVFAGAREVTGPMTFSTLIIAVAFLPLFTMGGVAGVIFSPMAHTYAFAIGGAILMALTLTPVLATRFVRAGEEERESPIMRALHRLYTPLANAALARPKRSAALSMIPIVLCVILYPLLGNEFMPKLEEGNFWIRATLPMSISIDKSAAYVGRMRSIVRGCPKDPNTPCTEANRSHPEVLTVVSQVGRPDDGTDVSGFHNIELFAPLRPFGEWPRHLTKAKLTEQLSSELSSEFPGVIFNFSQAISDNVEEAISGVKGENSLKVIGPDLEANEKNADTIVDVMSSVKGIADLGMFHSLGQPEVKITADRQACARYGLNTGHVMDVVQAAIGGRAVTQVYEGEKHFALTVRWLDPYRNSIEAIREITVTAPDNTLVPLAQLASIGIAEGPSMIYREDGSRYSPVKFSVRGRDLKSSIAEARQKIESSAHLPYDSHFEWGGEINELNEAMGRLVVVIPLTLFAIIFLVYGAVKSWVDTVIVVLSIPIACTGGVLALLITGTNFSVSAAMGFISIFGIAIQDSLLVVSYFQRLRRDENYSIVEAARVAAEQRFRPVLMTTLVAMLGLFPAAISNGIGAQTQKPLAIVVIGGALILAVLSRVLRPPLLVLAHTWLKGHHRPATALDDPLEESSGMS